MVLNAHAHAVPQTATPPLTPLPAADGRQLWSVGAHHKLDAYRVASEIAELAEPLAARFGDGGWVRRGYGLINTGLLRVMAYNAARHRPLRASAWLDARRLAPAT